MPQPPADPFKITCPSRHTLGLIGGKWTILLLCTLESGPVRTGDLIRSVEGVSRKMLVQTLRDLQTYGLVERVSYPEVPPRVEYRLSDTGRSLAGVVRTLEEWIIEHHDELQAFRVRYEAGAAPDAGGWTGG